MSRTLGTACGPRQSTVRNLRPADGDSRQSASGGDRGQSRFLKNGFRFFDLEKQYWQAIKDKDVDAATLLIDDPCILTGAQGVARISRDAIGKMQSAQYTLREFELTDPEVRMIRGDVAVLAYEVHERLTVEGQPVTLVAADASTWVCRDGRWVCAVHTESIKGDPFGRDRVCK